MADGKQNRRSRRLKGLSCTSLSSAALSAKIVEFFFFVLFFAAIVCCLHTRLGGVASNELALC